MNYYDELYHYGIPGQKWGVRRYQRPDGTLTDAGKARYNSNGTKKKLLEMSDEELRRYNNRISAEKQYKELNKSKFLSNTYRTVVSMVGSASAIGIADLLTEGQLGKNTIKKMIAGGVLAGITVGTILQGGQIVNSIGKKK